MRQQIFDLDTLAILTFSILAVFEWLSPAIRLAVFILALTAFVWRVVKDQKEEKRAIEAEKRAIEKRKEEQAEHALRMKLLEKELDQKRHSGRIGME